MLRENNPAVGAHFLSHNALLPTETTETFDACILENFKIIIVIQT